jgi:hypothetical protein
MENFDNIKIFSSTEMYTGFGVRFFTVDIKYDLYMSNSSAIRPHTIISTHLPLVAFQDSLFTANTEVPNTYMFPGSHRIGILHVCHNISHRSMTVPLTQL